MQGPGLTWFAEVMERLPWPIVALVSMLMAIWCMVWWTLIMIVLYTCASVIFVFMTLAGDYDSAKESWTNVTRA